MHDPHRFVNELDEMALDSLITRLEMRAKDPVFAKLADKYLTRLEPYKPRNILEVGCGTGVILRSLAQRDDFEGKACGIDQSSAFVNAAQDFAAAEAVSQRLEFQIGDAHDLDFESGTFDLVIAHTVLSHVTEPAKVLGEMSRVVRKDGMLVVFDGDYSSLTYAFPDHNFGRKMDTALANNNFNNPQIMRDLPRLLHRYNLKLVDSWGDAVVEIGAGDFFKSFAETYSPYIKKSGSMTGQAVDIWLNEQRRAMDDGTFFAACNYYTYLIQRI